MSLSISHDPEMNALSAFVDHLEPLDQPARDRVIRYLVERYGGVRGTQAPGRLVYRDHQHDGVQQCDAAVAVGALHAALDGALERKEITQATHRTIVKNAQEFTRHAVAERAQPR